MAKLSIFGGTGFIGSNFARLYKDECQVMPRDASMPLTDDVLYLSSTTHNYHVFTDVHLDINTNLNKLMDVLPVVKGTFNSASSWFCYGADYNKEWREAWEDSRCSPKGFYAITKKAAEDLIESYCNTFNKQYRIMRLCSVIGGDSGASSKKNAMEFLLTKIVKNEPVDIYKGDNYRTYLHVEDACRALKLVVETGKKNAIYNIGSGNSVRLIDVVEYAKKKTSSSSEIRFIDAPRFHQIVQAKDFFMNCDKLRNLGFKPQYSTYEAIDRVLEVAIQKHDSERYQVARR